MNNLTVTVETITPNTALEYLKKNNNNRKVSKTSVAFYKKQMIDGKWQLSPEGISFDKHGFLIDGQHRLLALVEANVNIQFIVSRGFDRSVFDVINTGKNRSASDVLDIAEVKNANKISASIKRVLLLRKGSADNARGYKHSMISNKDVLMMYESDRKMFDLVLNKSINIINKNRLISDTIVAATAYHLIVDKKHSIDTVFEFFNGLFKYSETKAVNDFRDRLILSKGNRSKMTNDMFNKCLIKSWNMYIQKKNNVSLRIVDNEILKFI